MNHIKNNKNLVAGSTKKLVLSRFLTKVIILMLFLLSTVFLTACSNPIDLPQVTIGEFNQSKDFNLTLNWKEVKQAKEYVIEYKYSIEKNKVHILNTEKTTCSIPRKRGNISFRLSSISKSKRPGSGFSEWQTFKIEDLILDKVEKFSLTNTNNRIDYEFSIVKYMTANESKSVPFYEIVIKHPGKLDYNYINPIIVSSSDKLKIYADKKGEYSLRIRAVNYIQINGENIFAPEDLHQLYISTDLWQTAQIIIK